MEEQWHLQRQLGQTQDVTRLMLDYSNFINSNPTQNLA